MRYKWGLLAVNGSGIRCTLSTLDTVHSCISLLPEQPHCCTNTPWQILRMRTSNCVKESVTGVSGYGWTMKPSVTWLQNSNCWAPQTFQTKQMSRMSTAVWKDYMTWAAERIHCLCTGSWMNASLEWKMGDNVTRRQQRQTRPLAQQLVGHVSGSGHAQSLQFSSDVRLIWISTFEQHIPSSNALSAKHYPNLRSPWTGVVASLGRH